MSASPSGQSNGPTPNGGPPQYVRKPKAADPLRPRKKPVRRPNGPPNPSATRPNGPVPAQRAYGQYPVNGVAPPRGTIAQQMPSDSFTQHRAQGGWTSQPPDGSYTDFPLFTTKRQMREGLRYHMARFQSKKEVDPRNQDEFTRPLMLHRRDPKQTQPGKGDKDEQGSPDDPPMDSKERERQEILREQKEKQKALDLAQIAPTGSSSGPAAKKAQAFRNEKTTQVHRLDKTEAQKKESDLKYEEALLWHLEDADNKNTWVGNYEAALSETNVIFVIEGGRFVMIPIEKWYKFTPKGQFKTFTIEEAEATLSKKTKESRWVMRQNEQDAEKRMVAETRKFLNPLYTVKAESGTFRNSNKRETQDMDDLDFNEDDLFQDDDEQHTVEKVEDEETKEAQDRIKREQLAANVFDQANEADVDQELREEELEAEKIKKFGKDVKKALKKRERNLVYESDSEHPYSDQSDDDTSDEEKQKEIDRKKDEEAKIKAAKADPKGASGTSSRGTNTPSGRPKHSDPLKKNNKRPGSPNLSESSGNESSRKKLKKKHHSSQPTGTSTPIPGSRPLSPAPSSQPGQNSRKSSVIKLNVSGNKVSDIQNNPPDPSPTSHMSDGEATGGEMSDGGTKKKIKLKFGGGSPTGSRSGSPAPGRAGSVAAGGSRAGSPAIQTPAAVKATGAQSSSGPILPQEIIAALPPTGVLIGDLMKKFKHRIGTYPQTTSQQFIQLVKQNAKYGPDKLLRPK